MAMHCRPSCGACCTAPSISSAIPPQRDAQGQVLKPGMPHGKPASVPCVHLDAEMRCRIFTQSDRPAVCAGLQPSATMCGDNAQQALLFLQTLERDTAPDGERLAGAQ
jgi:hypothetical protein